MGTETRKYGMDTELTVSMPWSLFRGGRAMCSDGKVRALTHIASTADTFFSIPAAVRVYENGEAYYVTGYVCMETAKGYSTHTEDDPVVVKFSRYDHGKNAHMLPGGIWEAGGGLRQTVNERVKELMEAKP